MVIKDELIAAHPELAADVFDAFAASQATSISSGCKAGQIEKPTEIDELHKRVMEITGDPLPYGIAPNRQVHRGADRPRRRRRASSPSR